jgi:RNA polymerase sigma-70 factor (ECF subfamily)
VVNAALMKLRRRKRKREEPIAPLLPGFLEDGHHGEPVSTFCLPDEELERKETRALVRRCIARLPESYRVVLTLRDIDELSAP